MTNNINLIYQNAITTQKFLLLIFCCSAILLSLLYFFPNININLFRIINFELFNKIPAEYHFSTNVFWYFLTSLGDTHNLFIIVVVLYLYFQKNYAKTELDFWLILVLIIVIISASTSELLKTFFNQSRPPRIIFTNEINIVGRKLLYKSFPSGHTLAIFVFVGLCLPLIKYNWAKFLAILLAILIGLSRIAVGAHWPIDVAGGAMLGSLIVYLGWYFYPKIIYAKTDKIALTKKININGHNIFYKIFLRTTWLILILNIIYHPFIKTYFVWEAFIGWFLIVIILFQIYKLNLENKKI